MNLLYANGPNCDHTDTTDLSKKSIKKERPFMQCPYQNDPGQLQEAKMGKGEDFLIEHILDCGGPNKMPDRFAGERTYA
jgi:hypothetical protein